jgi:ketosteroid isomerase-like protein
MKAVALGCLAALASCTQTTKGTAEPAVLSQLQQRVDSDYVAPFAAGEVDKWLRVLDDDVVGLHNRIPAMEGKEGLKSFAAFVKQNLRVENMSVKLTGLRQSGDLAYTWGTFHSELVMRDSGKPMPDHKVDGKVLFIWKRQADGQWKIAVDMGNDLPEPREKK